MSPKRPRSLTPSPTPSSLPSSPTSKFLRAGPEPRDVQLSCTLPPTCSHPNAPTHLSSTRDLEAHYATYHSHVCEDEDCGCVFPDPRLLELHIAECHDPITALKKDRGEKTFACHLASCPRLFLTPKARRLHLIQGHGYPKEYFFAVTNKGIGGLLSKWGQGASLVRGEWRGRLRDQNMAGASESDPEDDHHPPAGGRQRPPHKGKGVGNMPHSPAEAAPPGQSCLSSRTGSAAAGCADLAEAMTSLSLVPSKIRFGRGGKKGGFAHPPPHKPAGRTAHASAESCRNDQVGADGNAVRPRRRGGRRGAQHKTSKGMSGTGGDADAATMQE